MKKVLLLTTSMIMIALLGFSQTDRFWTVNAESRASITKDKAVARQSYPETFALFNLNATALREQLFSVVGRNSSELSTIISLPNAEGRIEQFEVFEASNFEPDLQERFPEIRAFSGKGITDKFATLKLSISPQGVQTMVFRTETANEFIEPFSRDRRVYSVYRANRRKGALPWTCSTDEQAMFGRINESIDISSASGSSTGQLKTMRLAQSCNGEYANYFGATSAAQVGLVLAAFNATLTRCNGIYEKDLALHLNLIGNTTAVIYYNPSTDPYTTMSSWNNQLQSTLTANIGEANYDIGHMFGASGGGGNAGCIGCVCVDGSKGRGITSPADAVPQGDNFDIDYVAHEVGHQLGGNHTFSMSSEGTGVNKEVGSGITIMGYAGITSQDVAPHSIDIFHQASIAQIQANLATKTCPVSTTMTANHAPTIATVSNYTIPISTPFALTGSATDIDNDAITYNWEQNDNSTTTGASSVASPTKATGPNWLSFPSTTTGTRLCPKLSTILAGANVTGPLPGGDAGANIEALSSVSRTLNFRLTVRDNRPYAAGQTIGQTAFADAVITVTNTAGPFTVTYPNSNVTIPAGAATITWNVNGTNTGSVNCQAVNILLSTDGGNTFTALVSSTANDGSETVTIPATLGTTNRIKVESVGNIFFDISNSNFTIGAAPACGSATGLNTSAITQTSATLNWSAVTNANSYAVDYKAASSGTWIVVAASTTNLTANLTGLASGTLYDWRVRATCTEGAGSYVQAQFTTTAAPGSACPGTEDIGSNGSISTASAISLNTDLKGKLEVRGDNDYYRFSFTSGGTITISLSTLPADYNLSLLNSSGGVIATSSNAGTTAESINVTVISGITYYARVFPKNNGAFNASSCYTLRVQTGTASRGVEIMSDVSNQLNVSPNPAGYSVNLSFNAKANGTGTVSVMNQTGAVVLHKTLVVTAGNNARKLDVGHLPNGMYFVKIQTGGLTQMAKLVIGK